MRVAFVGKGGSGKTTLSALFSRYLSAQPASVLAIDADVTTPPGRGQGLLRGASSEGSVRAWAVQGIPIRWLVGT